MAQFLGMGRAWPGFAVPHRAALAAAGADPDAAAVDCPSCGGVAVRPSSGSHDNRAGAAAAWLICPLCRWCGYGWDYVLDRFGGDRAAARAALRAAGCRPRAATWSASTDRAHRAHVGQLRRLRSFAEDMAGRHLRPAPGEPWPPHNHPLWWATTVYEWNALWASKGRPSDAENGPHAATAAPGYDADFRVTGAVLRRGSGWDARAAPGTTGGVLFRHALRPGEPGVVYESPGSATLLQLTASSVSGPPPAAVCPVKMGEELAAAVAADLGPTSRKWVVVPDAAGVDRVGAAWWALAAALDARVYVAGPHGPHPAAVGLLPGFLHAREDAEPWPRALLRYARHAADWRVRATLELIGWPGAARDAARAEWPRPEFDRFDALCSTHAGEDGVELRPGLWVYDTARGWVDGRGRVLVAAAPAVHRVAREGRKKVYRGVVRYLGQSHPFRSSRFRRDPAGVVETVLLAAGAADVPPPHPAVVPHMADLAAYFGRTGRGWSD